MKTKLLFFTIAILCSTFTNAQWQQTSLNTVPAYCLALNGSNIFAGSSTGMYLSSNNGTNWNSANTGLTSNIIKSLAVSGTNIFAGTEGYGVYSSSNNGSNWDATTLMDAIVPAIAVCGNNIFAGTFEGVFSSTNNGVAWNAVNTGLSHTTVFSLALNSSTLFAGTIDGGVYKRTLAEMISGINEIDNEKSISIFPNPFSFETVLKTKNGFKNISLSIYNSFGQQVKQINNISGPTINVQRDNLPSGIYFIQLADENNVITTLKLIITD
ncbi:MAG TPA: T9SS type A sorting domain-containing protein [Bacteroidales bacterium]|nr:T9SS type A sorting domain-containing protein [Bacteroidales bacterium]